MSEKKCDTCGEPTRSALSDGTGWGVARTTYVVCTVDALHKVDLQEVTLSHLKDQLNRIYKYQKERNTKKCDEAKLHLYTNLLPRASASVSDEFLGLLKAKAASGETV